MELMQQRQRGFHCEMDATFNGLESEADGGVGGGGWGRCNSRCRERGEEALMESRIIQSFSSPNDSNRLFICWQIYPASEAIITVHSVM